VASVFERGRRWYIKYKDGAGRWVMKACTARTKTEAKRLAHDLERQAERQRHGLEDMPAADGGGTVAQLLARWLAGRPDAPFASRDTSAVRRHLLGSELADIPLARLRGHDIENLLARKTAEGLAPQTVKHLRVVSR